MDREKKKKTAHNDMILGWGKVKASIIFTASKTRQIYFIPRA